MDKHLLVKRTLGCVCAATLMGAALATHHDSLNTVKAEEKTVQVQKELSSIDSLHYLSENSKVVTLELGMTKHQIQQKKTKLTRWESFLKK